MIGAFGAIERLVGYLPRKRRNELELDRSQYLLHAPPSPLQLSCRTSNADSHLEKIDGILLYLVLKP